MMVRVGIYGATGYTGLELMRLLTSHPHAEVNFATSEGGAGNSLREISPQAPDIALVTASDAPLDNVEAIFLCLPHTTSAPVVVRAVEQGIKVIDLSADLRLDDPAVYEEWYKSPHPAPQLLPAPYGLPELGFRDEIALARYVANPGCYATAVLLGLGPLAKADLLNKGAPIIADAKSGVTGGGRSPKQNLMFGEVHGNFAPYNIGRAHRHLPEIEQVLAAYGVTPGSLIFSPHLLPTDRGILVTLYVSLRNSGAARQVFDSAYGSEPLVDVLPEGELASLAYVVRTPRAALSLTHASDDVMIVVVALDNLLKGAASQAVQNFNLMWGFPETCGLMPSVGGR